MFHWRSKNRKAASYSKQEEAKREGGRFPKQAACHWSLLRCICHVLMTNVFLFLKQRLTQASKTQRPHTSIMSKTFPLGEMRCSFRNQCQFKNTYENREQITVDTLQIQKQCKVTNTQTPKNANNKCNRKTLHIQSIQSKFSGLEGEC